MDYKVLYRKYRPDDFANIIGQDFMLSILKNAIKKDKLSHAYIFSGPRGTGKTSTAKVFAKAINCLDPKDDGPCNKCESCLHFKENADIIEIDAASNNGVEEIRELINNIKLAPSYSKYKVYIIDEVHMLSTSAFNALLLTLEEPPKHIVFILATTNIEAVPITILSRCQRFDFHKISLKDIKDRLKYIISEEKIKIDDEAIEEIAYISDGGMRDALSILDQLSGQTTNITIDIVASHFGSISKKKIDDLYNLIIENNVNEFAEQMQNLKDLAIDYKLLIKKLLEKIEKEAIKSKKESDYMGLPYSILKAMAYDLAGISNYVTLNIDPFTLIEITILNYFPGNNLLKNDIQNSETLQLKEEKEEKKNVDKTKIDGKNDNIKNMALEQHANSEEIKESIADLIDVRINNCFVNAQKKYLQSVNNTWEDFITHINDRNLQGLLVDTNVTAASDKIIILTTNLEGTANLIDSKIKELENEYNKKYYSKYEFIAISEERWQEERKKYIENIKNKVEYKYIEKNTLEENETKNIEVDLEKTAFNIFDKDIIEFE